MSRVRRLGVPGRAGVTALVAGIGILGPLGVTPAWAQETTPPPADGYYATPPPLDPNTPLPNDSRGPDQPYKPTKGCVQSSLDNKVDIKNTPWAQSYLQLAKAQAIVKAAKGNLGANIKVAVVDTGVTPHPWFNGRVLPGGDYVVKTDDSTAGLVDCDGHGTEVAGIIAGRAPSPDIGFQGVAPDATIVSYRQLSQNYGPDNQSSSAGAGSGTPTTGGQGGSSLPPTNGGGAPGGGVRPGQSDPNGGGHQLDTGTAGNLTTLAEILRGIADKGDIKVVNMSVDKCRPSDGNIDAAERTVQAAVKYATDKGVVLVAAAGNTGDKCPQNNQMDPNKPKSIVTPPWFSDDVLSVAAIDQQTGNAANFSVNGPWVSVAAPGTGIISLDPAPNSTGLANLTIENGQPGAIQGTSFASPYVAGLAVLVREMFPDLSARQVMTRIEATAQHPAAPGGHDNYIGYGVINPVAALTASLPSDQTGKLPSVVSQPRVGALPPGDNRNWTPMVVALAGTGGGILALLVTLFVMHTIRRNRATTPPPKAR